MNYREARAYIEASAKYGSVLGLESIKRLMKELADVQDRLKVLHVAGTNGKGSTIAYISEILKQSGYKVGRYTSPAVFDYLEIFSVNGEKISEDDYALCMTEVRQAVERILQKGYPCPTSFEMETALAYLYFYKMKCDICIIETGLGGDLDATNVVENTMLSVITSISLDHTQYLGDTITEIAGHKAGIIKKDSAVVCGLQGGKCGSEVYHVIREKAKKQNAELICVNEPVNMRFESGTTVFDYCDKQGNMMRGLETHMLGVFQTENAANAIEAALFLRRKGYGITEEHIREGIKKAVWHGRFEKICDTPKIYFDGGHNPGAAEYIRKTIEIYFTNEKIIYIIGVLADKDYDSVLRLTGDIPKGIITIAPHNARALSAEQLRETAIKYNDNVTAAQSVAEAIDMAESQTGEDGVIMIFGSLSYLWEVKDVLRKRMK